MKKLTLIILIFTINLIAISQIQVDSVKLNNTYDSLVLKSDSLFKVKQYLNAKETILKAGNIYPSAEVVNKLDKINHQLGFGKGCGTNQYSKILDKGNELYVLNNFVDAKKLYERALKLWVNGPDTEFINKRLEKINKQN